MSEQKYSLSNVDFSSLIDGLVERAAFEYNPGGRTARLTPTASAALDTFCRLRGINPSSINFRSFNAEPQSFRDFLYQGSSAGYRGGSQYARDIVERFLGGQGFAIEADPAPNRQIEPPWSGEPARDSLGDPMTPQFVNRSMR